MTGGDAVTNPDYPGAVGIISVRKDTDEGVEYLVSWTLADGATRLEWHSEDSLAKGVDNI